MDKGTAVSAIPGGRKAHPRAALVNLHEPVCAVLGDCFRQFGVETISLTADALNRLQTQKFEACVLELNGAAETLIQSARNSASNSRLILYGVGGTARDAMKYSKYGINAFFRDPLERSAALKLVKATQTLVLHELRRYVRIPVMTEVSVSTADNRRFNVTSREISAGGMSMSNAEDLSSGQRIELSFALLTLPRIWVRGDVTWRRGKNVGIHFDPDDERRYRIKGWVDAYLEG